MKYDSKGCWFTTLLLSRYAVVLVGYVITINKIKICQSALYVPKNRKAYLVQINLVSDGNSVFGIMCSD